MSFIRRRLFCVGRSGLALRGVIFVGTFGWTASVWGDTALPIIPRPGDLLPTSPSSPGAAFVIGLLGSAAITWAGLRVARTVDNRRRMWFVAGATVMLATAVAAAAAYEFQARRRIERGRQWRGPPPISIPESAAPPVSTEPNPQ